MKIYPSITTVSHGHFKKLEEASRLGLEEVCFFSTGLSLKEREDFYPRLEKSTIKSVPLVHLRDDSELWELDFFVKNFQTRAFNCHSQSENEQKHDLSKYKNIIFVENTYVPWLEEEIKRFGGVCLDFAHLDQERVYRPESFKEKMRLLKKYPRGCAHLSVEGKFPPLSQWVKLIKKLPFMMRFLREQFSSHYLHSFTEYNFLRRYQEFFPEIMAIELENPLEEQLKAIDYLSSKICTSKV